MGGAMKKLILACAALLSSIPVAAQGQDASTEGLRTGRCTLRVNGVNRITGRCLYSTEPDGSFYIRETGRRRDDENFAYLFPTGKNTAEASWNGVRGARFAHARLGILKRSGACWTNRRVRLCLWAR